MSNWPLLPLGGTDDEPHPRPSKGDASGAPGALDAAAALTAAGDVAFQWDLASDAMTWQSNVAQVLGIDTLASVASGAGFHLLFGTEHDGMRHRCIRDSGERDSGSGVAYQLQYKLQPAGRRRPRHLWIEERGRWFAGRDGKPERVMGVLRVIDKLHEEIDRLRRLSEQDDLTGLMNRHLLLRRLGTSINEAGITSRPCVFMLAAINNLGIINQTFGFDVGDEVIATVAGRLAAGLRAGDSIGRHAGNKIGLIIHDCDADGLQAVGKRLISAVRASTTRGSTSEVSTTLSIGAVRIPLHAGTPAAAVAAALEALDQARQVRQDRLVCFAPGRITAKGRQRSIETAESVLTALEQQRMRVALQSVVHADTHQVAFHECLLRILAKDGSLTPACEFVPIAEQLGLASMIDRRVLELAVGLVKADPGMRISFNISGQTSGDHDWLVLLHKLTGGDRHITRRLTVEITETMALLDLDETAAFVDVLKEMGCGVALDDFGAGYTSFKNLKSLAIDMVKLDGTFVRNLKDDKANRFFVRSMVALAKNFGMTTVAEMVGDAETANILMEAGVDYLQGYYFGEPQVAPLPLPIAPKA